MEHKFVHLRLHTEFSLKDGLLTLPALMEKVAEYGMPAVGISDLSNLYATVKFYQAAFHKGIKPIIGADVYISEPGDQEPFLITLFCKNTTGYQNLLKLITQSFLKGQINGLPILQKTWLAAHAEGLIVLSGGMKGDVGQAILAHDQAKIKTALLFWMNLFPNHYYLEISRVGKPQENFYIESCLQQAEKYKLPLVATNDVRFLDEADFEAHEARVCIQEGCTLNDIQRSRQYTAQQYFRSQQEMEKLFVDIPQALMNSVEIAKRCNVLFELGINRLPYFSVPNHLTPEKFLTELAIDGLNQRLQTLQMHNASIDRKPYEERLNRELTVINSMGFAGYFLIVADFTKWAKENAIPVGPGRGSGPGSLVAYALKITDLDPIELDLLFERFLNPERVSMPDFDIDFCMEGRDRVIEYVIHKHGHDRVAQIITYGTMAAKAVVRDVGRVLALGYGFVDKIAKLIPFELGMTLEKALDQEPLLRDRYEKEEEVKTLIDLAKKLEGITRNVGKHAGGIVIAPGKLTDFVPLYCEPNEGGNPVTQFDKDDVEAVGLVKFDFLGLKTLTIIDRALRIINQNQTTPIDISLIPLNDAKTFSLLKACKSTAVFQLESHGMRDLIKRLHPDCFEDLIALVALFRPGPLQSGMVDDFINRKHGRAKVYYPHPKLEAILRPTYGVILYQEQVMQIAQELAGYTLGAADILRRAMGKKKPEEMAKQREIFCKGAVTRGVDADIAKHIFDLMEKFAGYGFNKSHSASYALISYQTAWLKANYPAAFMAAVLSSDMERTEKIITLLDECENQKLIVHPPDINRSEFYFKMLDEQNITYGLGAIKGVGESAIENVVNARKMQGSFKDLFDFCNRIDLKKVNRRALEALIKAGCFDYTGKNRSTLLTTLPLALQQAEQLMQNQMYGQHDLLGLCAEETIPQYVEVAMQNEQERLQGEKETLGFYLTGHPIHQFSKELVHFTTCRLCELESKLQQSVCVAGIILTIRTRQTKRGDKIGIFTIDDGSTQVEVVCFAESFQKYRSLLVEDKIIIIEGEVGHDDFSNRPRIIAKELRNIEQARERHAKSLQIRINPNQAFDLQALQQLLSHHPGCCPINLIYCYDDAVADIKLGKDWHIKPTTELMQRIAQQLSVQEIEYIY